MIIASCRENEVSKVMRDESSGIFTRSLAEGLDGEIDENKDGWIESGELYDYVNERVKELSNGSQHPVMKGNRNIKILQSKANRPYKLKWKFKVDGKIWSSPVIGKDGTVYIRSNDGHLYAIETSSGGLADTPWPMFRHDALHTGRYASRSSK